MNTDKRLRKKRAARIGGMMCFAGILAMATLAQRGSGSPAVPFDETAGRSDSSPTGDRAGRGPGRVAPKHPPPHDFFGQ